MIKPLLISLVSLALVLPAGAQEGGVLKREPLLIREAVKNEIKDTREAVKNNIQESRDAMQKRQADLRMKMQEEKEGFKNQLETRKTELRDKVEQKKTELKERLKTIKDERKKAVVEKLDKRFDEINQNRTTHLSGVLDKLSMALDRIVSRAEKANAKGLDISSVNSAVDAAKIAIGAARAAVVAQVGKTYPITISTEDKLKTDVGGARKALEQDLKLLRDMVKTTHDSVRLAATTLAKISGVDNDSPVVPANTNNQ